MISVQSLEMLTLAKAMDNHHASDIVNNIQLAEITQVSIYSPIKQKSTYVNDAGSFMDHQIRACLWRDTSFVANGHQPQGWKQGRTRS